MTDEEHRVRNIAEARWLRAKTLFSDAAVSVLQSQPKSVQACTKALAEIAIARRELLRAYGGSLPLCPRSGVLRGRTNVDEPQ